MRPALITSLVFIAWGHAATAQKLSLSPQIGIERNNTTLRYTDVASFSPLCQNLSPQASLRLDYRFRKGHGPYTEIGTTRPVVSVDFRTVEGATSNTSAETGPFRLKIEGGYQLSSKPFFFKKSARKIDIPKVVEMPSTVKKSCGGSSSYGYRGHCSRKSGEELAAKSMKRIPEKMTRAVNKGWSFRIQPSLGAAYVPALKNDVVLKNGNSEFTYNAGNYDLAVVSRLGFEFAKNHDRMFTIAVQYLKGVGNLGSRSVSSMSGTKTHITQVQSAVSGWSLKAGIPLNLSHKKPDKKIMEQKHNTPSKCQQYKMHCGRSI
ncbi:MAG TPA: hypothetical protein VM012_01360 [Flavitalea sp.]|nr:hypothetical protein [Flavitalea sp.]